MTQDEIKHDLLQVCKVKGWDGDFNIVGFHALCDKLKQLGAEEEREACAKVCDARYMGDNNREDMEAKKCAKAIRARGQPQVCCQEYNTCVRPCTPRGRHHGQEEEREACAKLCEEARAARLAEVIRARGQA